MKSIEAVEVKHRPGRFDAIEPSTNLRIFQKSWCNHTSSDIGLGIRSSTGLARYRTDSAAARHQRSPSRPGSRPVEVHRLLRL